MSISKSVYLTAIIPLFAYRLKLNPHFSRRRLIAVCALLPLLLIILLVLRQSNPMNDLETARVRWAATGITDYRIVVEYQRAYLTCQQDFEVRGATIGYKHTDSCNIGGAITGNRSSTWPTVEHLFNRIEAGQNKPQCGPNGCICDGPIEMTVAYDPQRGYPTQITYTLRQDLRSRDLSYWLAVLDGSLANCPQVTYIGQTIRITSLTQLPLLVDSLAEATPEVGVGEPSKPEITPQISIDEDKADGKNPIPTSIN